jgi:deoxycitidine kinase/deoxyguanosine kinase
VEYAKQNRDEKKRPVFITERCLDTDYHVFTKMLRAEGSIDKLEYELYERWFSQLKTSSTQLSAIVHVNTPPEMCAKRIRTRGRDGEENISIEYLEALDKYQRDWVLSGDVPFLQTCTEGVDDVSAFVGTLHLDQFRRVEV